MTFSCDEDVWRVVAKFEACEYSLVEFDHGRHLAVGLAYLSLGSAEEAMTRMRESLVRFSRHQGKMGYHETITRFWLERLAGIRGERLCQRANQALTALADKDLVFACYEHEVLMSEIARREWVPPRLPGSVDCCSLRPRTGRIPR